MQIETSPTRVLSGPHPAFDGDPVEVVGGAPGAGGAGRVAEQVAGVAFLEMEVVVGAVLEVGDVVPIVVVDAEVHSQVFAFQRHAQAPRVKVVFKDIGSGIAMPLWAVDEEAEQPDEPWRYPIE